MTTNTESIAVTGVSGRYPSCSNVEEFQKALFAGVDLVSNTHNRWDYKSLGTSPRLGLVNDFAYFDAAFFGINPKEANANDSRLRKLLEVSYEAIVDAGLNPTEIRGTNTGVFLGVTQNDISDLNYKGGIVSRSAAIMANIVSYSFDFKGPSLSVNTACSSGTYAIVQAIDNILSGRCSMALVGTVQHQYDPAESMELIKIGVLDVEGISRSFDAERKGYVKSEAIAAIFLQKASESKRIYATFAGAGTSVEGFKRDGLAHPSHQRQKAMFEDVYRMYNIDPLEVNYVETHCTGTRIGDVEEVQAIDEFYTKGRKHPLLIGSIKSNAGHTETSSGLVSLTKVIFAIREGMIPGNLYFKSPDPVMRGICEGRLKVIDKNMPLPNGIIAINSFGFGGANAMLLVRPYTEKKEVLNKLSHRLVHVSGRTEEGMQLMLENIIKHKKNKQFLSLIDNIFSKPIDNHNYRGYAILTNDSHYEIKQVSSKKRPVWYVYEGLGAQWPGMGKDLMKIEVFRNTMAKCANALKPHGIDLEDIVVNGTDETFTSIVNIFTAITAVAVSLTDVLTAMNIKPDGIIGHSVGEIACAYGDGLITAEQAVLLAHARGYATYSTDLVPGLMAAVGLSVEECSKLLPKDVYIACDNSDQSVTISGPEQAVKDFLQELSIRGVFNRTISNSMYALHSPHLAPAAPKMLSLARKVLPEAKLRSKKWLPSALPESEWNSELGKYNSAEYHYHNYVNRVEFRQLLKHVPKDAIMIEVSPRGLLQAILKRALDQSVTILPLAKPGVDNFDFFLSSIGQFYNSGGQVELRQFYKPVTYPVSYDTPMISSLIKWDHRVKWNALRFNPGSFFGKKTEIDMNDQSNTYLEGHVIDGKVILPAAGYIVLVWMTFARMLEKSQEELPVVFENVKTLRPILLLKNTTTTLIINIFKSTGYFEICLENELIPLSTGKIKVAEQVKEEFLDYSNLVRGSQYKLKISGDDFYNCLHLRGFDYSGLFLGVQQCDIDGRSAILKWNNNWIAFMDSMVQYVLSIEARGHSLPTIFEKIVINPEEHLKSVGPNSNLVLNYNKYLKAAKCGGIELRNIKVTNVRRRTTETPPTLKKYVFVPNIDIQREVDPFLHSVNVASQIVIENSPENLNIKIAEIRSDTAAQILKNTIERVNLKKIAFYQIDSIDSNIDDFFHLLIIPDITKEEIKTLNDCTRRAKFIFAKIQNFDLEDVEVIYQHVTKSGTYVLFRGLQNPPDNHIVITASNSNYNWVRDLKLAVKKLRSTDSRIYLVNEDFNSGVIGLFNTIRLERYCPILRVFFIRSYKDSEPFSLGSEFYATQLKKDLTVNIYQDGSWGTFRLLPLESFKPRLFSDACLLKDNKGIKWVQKSPYSIAKEVCIHYASISKWDVSQISGRTGNDVDQECVGLEYSGIDKNGNNVMGLVPKGALATSVQAHPKLTWSFNGKWSLEEAATIPLPYTLSYYGLFIQTHLSSESSILIHNPTSDCSLAAIALALNRGCVTYIVVNSSTQNILKKNFPKIEDKNLILHSESSPFYETIMKKTNQRGVNTIFNCNSSDLLKLSRKCISQNGNFIEIDNSVNEFLVVDDLAEKNCSYHNINIYTIFEEDSKVLNNLANSIDKIIKEGAVIPCKYSVFCKDDIEIALKHFEEKGHAKKSVIKIKDNGGFFAKPESRILAYPRTYMNPDKSYIIVGGLGGFGFELANWLIERGATKVILNSRREVRSGYHAQCLQRWNNEGFTVLTNTYDTTTLDGAECLLNFAANLAPVGGIFNAALHVKDEVVAELTTEDFASVAVSKIYSAHNMDILSRKLCKKLDYFVMFSSIASSIGNLLQANYSFANSAVERLCETRKAEGLPGLAIEWGPLADVGILVKLKTNMQILETQRQKLGSCLEVVDQFMQQSEPVVVSCVYGNQEDEVSKKQSLAESVAGLFGIQNIEEIDDSKTLLDLGMDSLLGFEIKHLLSKESDADFSVNDIRNMTFEKIKSMCK